MNRVFHIGIVLAVAVHMLCGCCLHHAHAHGGRSNTRVSAVETGCCQHHDGSQHERANARGSSASGNVALALVPPDGSSDHQHCDGAHCVFTRPDSNDSFVMLTGAADATQEFVFLVAPTRNVLEFATAAFWHPGITLRIHLKNQAFLL